MISSMHAYMYALHDAYVPVNMPVIVGGDVIDVLSNRVLGTIWFPTLSSSELCPCTSSSTSPLTTSLLAVVCFSPLSHLRFKVDLHGTV